MRYLRTIMSKGIWVTATMNVMKNSNIRNGYIVVHGGLQGPAVATGTTVTSAKSSLMATEAAAEDLSPAVFKRLPPPGLPPSIDRLPCTPEMIIT